MAGNRHQRPPPMVLVNMVTNEALEAQFNPAEFEEVLGANYARQTVPGLSHQVLQFVHTENTKYNFELFFESANGGPAELKRNLDARIFLQAACHPWRAGGVKRGGAPRLLFIWPKLISLSCVVTGLSFKYTRFNIEDDPVVFTAKVVLEEVRDTIVTMDDVIAYGTRRTPEGFQVD